MAVLVGFFGATLAVYGYETVLNILGKAGVGPRKTWLAILALVWPATRDSSRPLGPRHDSQTLSIASGL